HGRGVLHRSLRPAAVVVRRQQDDSGTSSWQVKLLDAGLALKRTLVHASASHTAAFQQTGLGRSVARTLAYAAPEVVGRPKGNVWIGPHSDLFSFGRLCAFALTGRPDPDAGDRVLLSDAWKALLDDCTAWLQSRRPAHCKLVLERLSALAGPGDFVARVERAMYESTLADHTAALTANPDDPDAHVHRAVAYFRQGDYACAVADLDAAIRLRPEDAALFRRRAQTHVRLGNLDAAIADYTHALRLDPNAAETFAGRGLAYSQREDYDRAIADYGEALRLNPRDEAAYHNRGNAHFFKGDYDQAIADYTDALRLE